MSFHKMTGTDEMNSYQDKKTFSLTTTIKWFTLLLLLTGLSACGDGDNPLIGDNVGNREDDGNGDTVEAVTVSTEVSYFRDTVYNGKDAQGQSIGILRKHCSNCHIRNNVSPAFADGNVNTAYAQINGRTDSDGNLYANLNDPSASRLVTKVAGGHNCWSNSGTNCSGDASDLATQIQEWADRKNGVGGGGGGDTPVEAVSIYATLAKPVDADPEVSKSFPDPDDLENPFNVATSVYATGTPNIHDLVTEYCSECHISTSATPQAPFFADSDPENSYVSITTNQKIDINTPENSRIYSRLADDSHNCWTTCSANASEMLSAIQRFADSITVDAEIDPDMEPSKALELLQGQVVSGGSRYEVNVIAKYTFDEGGGTVAEDSSGIDPQMNLNLNENVGWVGGWGIDIQDGGKAIATVATSSQKLYDSIVSTGEMSIEAWVIPADTNTGTTAEPAPIVTYSAGTDRNFTLGQALYNYTSAVRISTASANSGSGEQLSTPDADEVLQATQQHVVMTYDIVNGRRIYVNGNLVSDADGGTIDFLDQWDSGYLLALGAETDGTRQWKGKIRLLAIHSKVLTEEQIQQNFDAGVGQKFNMLFKIGHMDDDVGDTMPDLSYLWFTVSEFDDFSYLFANPQFIVLEDDEVGTLTTTLSGPVNIKGIKIGMNGKEVDVGQAFANVDVDLTESPQIVIPTTDFDFGDGNGPVAVPVTATGTIIAKQNGTSGQNADQFFLSFTEIAGKTGLTTDSTPLPFEANEYDNPGDPYVVGLRTFDELNATMAEVTGVDPTTISDTFDTLKQQLPSNPDMKGFLSSMQMAVANLAGVYCEAMVENATLRTNFFGNFAFTSDVATAFGTGDSAEKNQIVDALVSKMVGTGLNIQPDAAAIKTALIGDGSDTATIKDANDKFLDGNLYGKLYQSCENDSGCQQDAARTRTIVKGMCMAVLGSAAISHQ